MLTKSKTNWVAVIGVVMVVMVEAAPAQNVCDGVTLKANAYAGGWYDGIKKHFVVPFETKTGATIELVPTFGENVTQILAAPADNPPYDVTTVFAPDFPRGLEEGIWLPLRRENVPNLADVEDWFLTAIEGMDTTYAAPFDYLYTAIGYNKETLGFTPTHFEDLWRPEAQGKIALNAEFWFIWAGATALTLDDLPNDGELYTEQGFDKMIEKLQRLDVAMWFDSGADGTAAMIRGDVALLYDAIELVLSLAVNNPEKFGVVVPGEGITGTVDYWAVVRGTKHRDCAEAFVNYLLDPEAQAAFAEDVPYWLSNSKVKFGPIASKYVPSTVEERAEIAIIMDWDYILENWDTLDTRLRREVMSR